MNLIVDVGNSRIKLAVFEKGMLLQKEVVPHETFIETLEILRNKYNSIKTAIVSSVGNLDETNNMYLKSNFDLHVLSHQSTLPFENKYSTPSTLGVDRIALASAACLHYPNENVLIIDAGSCITYDFLNENAEYLGGAIAPGIEMRYKAVHTFTANLPLLDKEIPSHWIGNNTSQSIHVGVSEGVIKEIEGFIVRYKKEYHSLRVILTGGDANFLLDRLKNDIFANSNFLLEGLNYILEINKDSC